MLDRAFTGLLALSEGETDSEGWWTVLGIDRHANWQQVKESFYALAKVLHPNANSQADPEAWLRIDSAYRQAMKHFEGHRKQA